MEIRKKNHLRLQALVPQFVVLYSPVVFASLLIQDQQLELWLPTRTVRRFITWHQISIAVELVQQLIATISQDKLAEN